MSDKEQVHHAKDIPVTLGMLNQRLNHRLESRYIAPGEKYGDGTMNDNPVSIGMLNKHLNQFRMEPKHTVLKYKKLTEYASAPVRGTEFAAGYDLSSAYDYTVPPHGKELIKTDLALIIPEGHYGRIAPRSGMSWKFHTDIGAGVIDEDYRGNVGIVLFNHSDSPLIVLRKDKVAQLVLERNSTPETEEIVGELPIVLSKNGAVINHAGYGSTDKK